MEDLSLHILDILQNSTAAGASLIKVSISTGSKRELLMIAVEDNGCGMSEKTVREVTDPFVTSRKTRRVGLGLSLLKAAAEGSGGNMKITSAEGKGTSVEASFGISNIDRPPLGDVAGILTDVAVSSDQLDLEIVLESGEKVFRFETREIKERLGEVPISEYAVAKWIAEYLEEAVKEIFGGVLDEVDSRFGRNKEEDAR
jgi:hypothetical protein